MQTITKKSKVKLAKKQSNSSILNKKLLPQHLNKKLQLSNEKINELISLLNSGALDECVQSTKQLADFFPKNGLVWKILGTAYQRQGLNELSINALKNASQLLPKDYEVCYNIANAHFDLYQLDDAITFYRKAISIAPNFFEAYFNLASVFESQSNYALAESIYKSVLDISPDQSDAYFSLAALYFNNAENVQFSKAFNLILKQYLTSSEASLALAISFENEGQIEASELVFQHATSLKPDNLTELYVAYSEYFSRRGNIVKAISFLNKTLEVSPIDFNANSHLGIIYLEQKQFSKAEHYLSKAIEIKPDDASAYNHFGLFLYRQGNLDQAEKYLKKALELSPKEVTAMNNLGLVYEARFEHAKAVDTFKKALKLKSDYVPALINIALSLNRLGKQSEAINYAKQGLAQEPTNKSLLINIAVIYQAVGDIQRSVDANLNVLEKDAENMLAYNNLFYSLSITEEYSQSFFKTKLEEFGATLSKMAYFQYENWKRQSNHAVFRIGFVSADFFDHPVGSFLLNVIQNINKQKFELIAYTNNAHVDEMTVALKQHFQEWYSIVGLSDQESAKKIYYDQIDLLIDLSGHTSGNRLPMFAYKPAPVQMTWLGYWDSTGVEQMDYILLDEMSAPTEIMDQFTEQIQYIPETRFCYSPPRIELAVNELPAKKNGYITFGAYHNYAKVTDNVIIVWASILRAIPNARLRWQTKAFHDKQIVEKTYQKFFDLGVSQYRIELVGFMTRKAYLESYHQVDCILDCFPFSACTTTCDALWMGVPTLTFPSHRLGGRQGASLMNAVGLSNWIANDKSEFVIKAVELSMDIDGLSIIRSQLRQQLFNSTLGNGKKFAEHLQTAFVDILKRHEIITFDMLKTIDSDPHENTTETLEDAIQEVFQIALQNQENGKNEEAIKGYLEILKVDPNHAEANHHLGFIETHTKGVEIAITRFERAVKAKPESEQFWVSYIDALIMSNDYDTALEAITHGQKFGLTSYMSSVLVEDIKKIRETFARSDFS